MFARAFASRKFAIERTLLTVHFSADYSRSCALSFHWFYVITALLATVFFPERNGDKRGM